MLAALDHITRYFGDTLIFDSVSASIEDGDRIGLIGANGIGKSTLLNVLCGQLAPDDGAVSVTKGVHIGFLQQNSGLSRENTVYAEMRGVFAELLETAQRLASLEQQIAACTVHDERYQALCEEYSNLSAYFEARDGYHIDVKIRTVLNGMGFEEKNDGLIINALSGGEKTRLALAKLLLEEPELLVLDEPTNHLDFRTLMWLEDYLQSYRGGLVVVSHDRYFLDRMVTKIWELESRKLYVYPGNYTRYKTLRAERVKQELRAYEAQQNKIASMREYAEKNIVRASTSNMAKSRLHQLEHIEVLERPNERTPVPHFSFTYSRRPVKDLLTVKNLTVSVGAGDERVRLSGPLDFSIKRGDKVALIGPNGAGKSTLLKTILGLLPKDGEVTWGANVQTAFYEQENRQLNPGHTALEELWGAYPLMAEYEIRGLLGQVLIRGEEVYKKIAVLSGGERARTALALLMLQHANTLILDEPTNHLDLPSKEALEEALREFDGTLIFVSHDRYFLNTIPTRIFELSPDGLSQYNGNFDFYLEEKKRREEKRAQEAVPVRREEQPSSYHRSKQERAEQVKRKQRFTKLETLIEETEEKIALLNEQIADPETGRDYEKLSEFCAELEKEKNRHEEILAEWMELSEFI